MLINIILNICWISYVNSALSNGDLNVYGDALEECCTSPMTGYYRNGFCSTGPTDYGRHIVCSTMTQEFLDFSKSKGNDLITPHPQFNFPGLKPGDCWCLCALRWKEALNGGVAPPVNLHATHRNMLQYVSFDVLNNHTNASQAQPLANASLNEASKQEL